MGLLDALADWLTGEDIIDAEFILTDLEDIDLTTDEWHQQNHYDAAASNVDAENNDIPVGKQVY